MADRIALVVRQLNLVASAGQQRAAVGAALAELDAGAQLASSLSMWSTPNPGEAYDTISILRSALSSELTAIGSMADDSAVDPQSWTRTRREVERAYVEVSGIEGAAGASERVSVVEVLGDAIANAPQVFGHAVGEVLQGAGTIVGGVGAGFLSGLGVLGVLALIVVVALVVRAKGLA